MPSPPQPDHARRDVLALWAPLSGPGTGHRALLLRRAKVRAATAHQNFFPTQQQPPPCRNLQRAESQRVPAPSVASNMLRTLLHRLSRRPPVPRLSSVDHCCAANIPSLAATRRSQTFRNSRNQTSRVPLRVQPALGPNRDARSLWQLTSTDPQGHQAAYLRQIGTHHHQWKS